MRNYRMRNYRKYGKATCGKCKGSGKDVGRYYCPDCNGAGWYCRDTNCDCPDCKEYERQHEEDGDE